MDKKLHTPGCPYETNSRVRVESSRTVHRLAKIQLRPRQREGQGELEGCITCKRSVEWGCRRRWKAKQTFSNKRDFGKTTGRMGSPHPSVRLSPLSGEEEGAEQMLPLVYAHCLLMQRKLSVTGRKRRRLRRLFELRGRWLCSQPAVQVGPFSAGSVRPRTGTQLMQYNLCTIDSKDRPI